MASGYSSKNYHQIGGSRWVVGASGSLDVESGGEIDIESGGALKVAGVDVTAELAQINGTDRIVKVKKVALTAATGAGATLSVVNPEAAKILITRLLVELTGTQTTGGTINVGTASGAAVASDNLIDGGVTTATGLLDSADATDQGTNGKASRVLASGYYVTGTIAAGAVGTLAGNAYIHYVKVA